MVDIHNYERQYNTTLKLLKKSDLSETNKKLILDFVNDLVLENLSKPRLLKYLEVLRIFAKNLPKNRK